MSTKANAWMSNPQYLAQIGHTLGGYGIILTTTIFAVVLSAGWKPTLIALAVGIVIASLKEFVYDTNTKWGEGDSWSDSLMDWTFYMVGGGLGIGVSALVHYLVAHLHHCS
jgi:hypothetical protein